MSLQSKAYRTWVVSETRRKLKAKAVAYLGGKCVNCGYSKSNSALEFHHLDPNEKDMNISGKVMSWSKLTAELDKCVLLCSNCHKEAHDKLRQAHLESQKDLARSGVRERKPRIVLNCPVCGNEFFITPSAYNRRSGNHYCKNSCAIQGRSSIPSRDELIVLLESHTIKELAANLGVDPSTLSRKCRKLGIPYRNVPLASR